MAQKNHNALPNGYEIDGYRIESVMGAGGFGITYRAREIAINQKVAVREYFPGNVAKRDWDGVTVQPADESRREDFSWGLVWFRKECETLVGFRHPNIVKVRRYFESNDTAYMVMDYEEGATLDSILRRHSTLGDATLRKILFPFLDALAAVHKAEFVHRDIRPGSIFVRANGSPLLLDFGGARQALGVTGDDISTSVSSGYAALEQYGIYGDEGPWTDIYALAATFYRAITGTPPPDAKERWEAVRSGDRDPYVSALEVGGGRYGDDLLHAIDFALAVKPEDRPQSLAEFRWLLDEVEEQKPTPIAEEAPDLSTILPQIATPNRSLWQGAMYGMLATAIVGFLAWIVVFQPLGGDTVTAQVAEAPSESAATETAAPATGVDDAGEPAPGRIETAQVPTPSQPYVPPQLTPPTADAQGAAPQIGFTTAVAPPDTLWQQTFGGFRDDRANAITALPDGGFIVAGKTSSKGAGSSDAWVLLLDRYGKLIWERTLGGPEYDRANSVIALPDGGFAMAGHTGSQGAGERDAWVVRLDSSGRVIWEQTLGGPGFDTALSIIYTQDGGFAVAGYTDSKGAGNQDAWVLRLDANGKLLWDRTVGGGGYDGALSLVSDSAGGLVVVGETDSRGAGGQDALVARLDAQGGVLWERTFGGAKDDIGWSVIALPDGGFAISGNTRSLGAGDWDAWVLRLDGDGELLWEKTFGGKDVDFADSIVALPAGGFAVSGLTGSKEAGQESAWILGLDHSGRLLWEKTFAGETGGGANALVALPDGGFALAGQSKNNGSVVNNAWIVRLGYR